MGADDKIQNKAQEWTGKGKEAVGDATGDDQLRAEGQADQGESALKQAGEKVKDAASKVKDAVTGK
ncbi:CsbD family protein [Pseudonocardia abyssalis]|uniref:CsbD family protein n=1 Tax=Pseudonocardia abyssalis TaxID=2792008 RepID=A0ABS6ULI0_9PSEU|nr:CsbD family protein [Pseudonocardia abyssalis]MBW0118433.1 CsbD family protein [Pseudonocardia abyssalis]MBW0133114.1 CsbD family protein [Pseudonocardia abyssalis]